MVGLGLGKSITPCPLGQEPNGGGTWIEMLTVSGSDGWTVRDADLSTLRGIRLPVMRLDSKQFMT